VAEAPISFSFDSFSPRCLDKAQTLFVWLVGILAAVVSPKCDFFCTTLDSSFRRNRHHSLIPHSLPQTPSLCFRYDTKAISWLLLLSGSLFLHALTLACRHRHLLSPLAASPPSSASPSSLLSLYVGSRISTSIYSAIFPSLSASSKLKAA